MDVVYKHSFVKQFKKLPPDLQKEVLEKIELFKTPNNHKTLLKVHKLKGDLSGLLSFSVNYRFRIVFEWKVLNKSASLITVGDHGVYR